jgi:uncharacterized protein (TIGR00369 family)
MRDGWDLARIRAHIDAGLPVAGLFGIEIAETASAFAVAHMAGGPRALRPGGIVAGPALFAMADVATYALILAATGDAAAVTVDLTINFLRAGVDTPVVARAEPLRAGRRLFTADIRLASAATDRLIAQATATYAMSDG